MRWATLPDDYSNELLLLLISKNVGLIQMGLLKGQPLIYVEFSYSVFILLEIRGVKFILVHAPHAGQFHLKWAQESHWMMTIHMYIHIL